MHQEYPKFIYHKSEDAKIIQSKEEQDEHGPEWKESPAHFEQKEEPSPDKPKKAKVK